MKVPATTRPLLLKSFLFLIGLLGFDSTAQAQLSLQHLPSADDILFKTVLFEKEALPGLEQAILTPDQLPRAYAYHDLAFFCRLEVQLESSLSIPFKIRLGSVDYVNYLEQKNPYQRW